ncbi:hypothetical protein BKA64DRAFT_643683 [Cadophora sp. MPI-SDFR-AT-0126]|nr:hypothetical protein BKA64DRAFT_643683 [Leotiomycetes sp. MPI-SDFR-AT-0126]
MIPSKFALDPPPVGVAVAAVPVGTAVELGKFDVREYGVNVVTVVDVDTTVGYVDDEALRVVFLVLEEVDVGVLSAESVAWRGRILLSRIVPDAVIVKMAAIIKTEMETMVNNDAGQWTGPSLMKSTFSDPGSSNLAGSSDVFSVLSGQIFLALPSSSKRSVKARGDKIWKCSLLLSEVDNLLSERGRTFGDRTRKLSWGN